MNPLTFPSHRLFRAGGLPLSPEGLCHNEGNGMFVILNPSPYVTLSEAKGLAFWLRVNSVKNLTRSVILNEVKDLMSSFALLRTCFG